MNYLEKGTGPNREVYYVHVYIYVSISVFLYLYLNFYLSIHTYLCVYLNVDTWTLRRQALLGYFLFEGSGDSMGYQTHARQIQSTWFYLCDIWVWYAKWHCIFHIKHNLFFPFYFSVQCFFISGYTLVLSWVLYKVLWQKYCYTLVDQFLDMRP